MKRKSAQRHLSLESPAFLEIQEKYLPPFSYYFSISTGFYFVETIGGRKEEVLCLFLSQVTSGL